MINYIRNKIKLKFHECEFDCKNPVKTIRPYLAAMVHYNCKIEGCNKQYHEKSLI